MRKRGTHAEGKQFSSGRLCPILAPSVLSVGLALNGAGCAHATPAPKAPQANEPVGYLLRPVGIYPIGIPYEPAFEDPAPNLSYSALLAFSKKMGVAIAGCNIDELKSAVLSYSEFNSLATAPARDEVTYVEVLNQWLRAATREFCPSGRDAHVLPIGEALPGEAVVVPPGDRWKRPLLVSRLSFACVESSTTPSPVVNDGVPLTLVVFNGVWRILPMVAVH